MAFQAQYMTDELRERIKQENRQSLLAQTGKIINSGNNFAIIIKEEGGKPIVFSHSNYGHAEGDYMERQKNFFREMLNSMLDSLEKNDLDVRS